MMKKTYILIFVLSGLVGCHNNNGAATEPKTTGSDSAATADPPAEEEVKTPVTVTGVETGNLSDSIELNATSVFLQNSYLKSIATGYVKAVDAIPGEFVPAGKVLFTIETKESMVIGNSISKLDSSFRFSGVSYVRTAKPGYIT